MSALNPKQEAALLALLSCRTIEEAAAEAGVTPRTIARYLSEDSFRRAFRAARRQVYEAGLASLQSTVREAAEALRRNLACGKPSVEVMAARTIFDLSHKGIEIFELLERVEALERQLKAAEQRV